MERPLELPAFCLIYIQLSLNYRLSIASISIWWLIPHLPLWILYEGCFLSGRNHSGNSCPSFKLPRTVICTYSLHHMGNKNLDLYFAHCGPKKPTGYNVLSLVSFLSFAETLSECCGIGSLSQTLRCDPPLYGLNVFLRLKWSFWGPAAKNNTPATPLQHMCSPNLSSQWFFIAYFTVFTLILIYCPFSRECISLLPNKMLKHQF